MGRPVLIRMVHCDPVRLSEEQSDEFETVVNPGNSRFAQTVRLYVSQPSLHVYPSYPVNVKSFRHRQFLALTPRSTSSGYSSAY